MTGRAKLWYAATAVRTIAFLISVFRTEIGLAGLTIVMVILCLVMGDES